MFRMTTLLAGSAVLATSLICSTAQAETEAMLGPVSLSEKVQIGDTEASANAAFLNAKPQVIQSNGNITFLYGDWQIGFCSGRVYNVSRVISRSPDAFMKSARSLNGLLEETSVRFPKVYGPDGDASSMSIKWKTYPNYELSLSNTENSWIVSEGNSVLCKPS